MAEAATLPPAYRAVCTRGRDGVMTYEVHRTMSPQEPASRELRQLMDRLIHGMPGDLERAALILQPSADGLTVDVTLDTHDDVPRTTTIREPLHRPYVAVEDHGDGFMLRCTCGELAVELYGEEDVKWHGLTPGGISFEQLQKLAAGHVAR